MSDYKVAIYDIKDNNDNWYDYKKFKSTGY